MNIVSKLQNHNMHFEKIRGWNYTIRQIHTVQGFSINIWESLGRHSVQMQAATVRFTSMNPRLFGVRILLIFLGSTWARDKPNTNFRILISRAFTWAYQIFTPTNSTADIRQNMILSNLLDLLEIVTKTAVPHGMLSMC